MENKLISEGLKASYLTLTESKKILDKSLPKAMSVNNSTGLAYVVLVFLSSFFIITNAVVEVYSSIYSNLTEIAPNMEEYIYFLEDIPIELLGIGPSLLIVFIVAAATALISLLLHIRPFSKKNNEPEKPIPETNEELIRNIQLLCSLIPEKEKKLKKFGLYMNLGSALAVLAGLAASIIMIGGILELNIAAISLLTAAVLIIIYLIVGAILKAILFSKIPIADIDFIRNNLNDYLLKIANEKNGGIAVESAVAAMKNGKSSEAVQLFKKAARLGDKNGVAASMAIDAFAESIPEKRAHLYSVLKDLIDRGIENADVDFFCRQTAATVEKSIAEYKKQKNQAAISKYNQAMAAISEKEDFRSALLLAEDAANEGISGAMLMDVYCRLVQTVSRADEGYIFNMLKRLSEKKDLDLRDAKIYSAVSNLLNPYIQRGLSISNNKTISAAVKKAVLDVITEDIIVRSVASAKKALKENNPSDALKFFNIAASKKSVEAMSAYLAVSVIKDLESGKGILLSEVEARLETMKKALSLPFKDMELEQLCKKAENMLTLCRNDMLHAFDTPKHMSDSDRLMQKDYMARIAAALSSFAEKNSAAHISTSFDFFLDD